MADMTTMKVQAETRDRVRQLGGERRWTADQVISSGVEALRREERRRQAAHDAEAISRDPEDLAEVRAVQADLDAWRAG